MDGRSASTAAKSYAKHGAPTRVLHWVNAVAMAVLIATGSLIWLARAGRAATALHLTFAFVLVAAGAAYALTLAATGRWRSFLPGRAVLADATAVVRFELGVGAHVPALVKYNGAQRLAYGAAILLAGGGVLTGCALLFRRQAPWLAAGLGGTHVVTGLHIACMLGIVAFALVHVIQVLRAGVPALMGMLRGTEPARGGATFDGRALADPRFVRDLPAAAAAREPAAGTRRAFLLAGSALATTTLLALTGSRVTANLNRRAPRPATGRAGG
jgi:thiosulfate reductase cytochrome b subunit